MQFINNCVVYNYNGVKIYYEFIDGGDIVNVFLHGWGRESSDFNELRHLGGYLLIDLPPFGKSENIRNWSIFTYANMVICLCRHLNIKKYNLIGHSFGGRISIIISAMEKDKVNKLVLIDSAGMKPKRNLNYKLKLIKIKIRKKLGLSIDKYASRDYKNLSPEMKKVFSSIVNTHLEESARLIDCKTLIVFGEKDKETPVYMAKKLNKLIKNSSLVILKNSAHFCFLERKILFEEILNNFIKEA